ncbi:MAG TPA: alpha/beta fold hydrolase [Bacteroidota bacterium]|nr:alpha/beta fold hydrolase [Bacteroidota bacterium]
MRLFFTRQGEGIPLIVLHGLFGSSDNWQTLGKRFAQHFLVYAIDQRNHGRSLHSDTHSYESMSGDLLEFFRDHNLAEAFIVGHSMGGKTAMRFALDHPAMVKKLVVVDIAPKAYPSQHDSILEALVGLDLTKYQSRNEIEQALAPKIPSTTTRQFLMKSLQRGDQGFSWRINLESINRSYDEMNREISGLSFPRPTLFLHSLSSGYVAQDDQPVIRSLFPAARFTGMNTGHWIHAEAPDEFFRTVLDFLTGNS